MIGAIWEAMTPRHIAIATGATGAYFGYIMMSYRRDTKSAQASNADESKVPKIMQRASIDEFMKKEEATKGKLVKRPSGSMAVFTEGGPALGGAESGAAH